MKDSKFFEIVSTNAGWSKFLISSVNENSSKILDKIKSFTENESSVGLIVGKVQSGKTSNIIGLAAKAFDQDFKIVIILFSDQNSLFNQNNERVKQAFNLCHNDVKIFNFSKNGNYKFLRKSQLDSLLEQDKKIIICSMKHKTYTNEITKIIKDTNYEDTTAIIIDDEGDDITQNNDKEKFKFLEKKSPNNEAVVNLKNLFNKSCYLTVTATPQAPLLLQSFQDLAIDFINLIEPGPGYMGLEHYHSGEDSHLENVIGDSSVITNKYKLPDSFIESLLFYLMGAVLRKDSKKDKHSMIIHSTKIKIEQGQIFTKIETLLNHFDSIDLNSNIFRNSKTKEIFDLFKKLYYKEKEYLEIKVDSEVLFKQIIKVSKEVALLKLNSESDLNSLGEQTENLNYFIVVGGDMLDRGLTIDGLAVNYFTREPTKGQIDTMLQRARWFGYKTEYKKFCRVYLTKGVSDMYSSIIESEDDLWAQLKIIENSSLKVKDLDINIYVPNKNLKPTSSSKVKVTKTSIKPWFVQKYFSIHKDHQEINKMTIENFLEDQKSSNYKYKQHKKYIVESKDIIDLFNKIKFSDSEQSVKDFIVNTFRTLKITESVKIDLIDMRYSTGEERSLISEENSSDKFLNNLMQGRNDDYPGDRNIIEENFMLQIHRVKLKDVYMDYSIGDEVISFSFGIPEDRLKENFFKKEKIMIEPKSLP
jgi:hypothetical protein